MMRVFTRLTSWGRRLWFTRVRKNFQPLLIVAIGLLVIGLTVQQFVGADNVSFGKEESNNNQAMIAEALPGSNNQALEDTDQDGLFNLQEEVLRTNPTDPDTDHDGYTDFEEFQNGYDPLRPGAPQISGGSSSRSTSESSAFGSPSIRSNSGSGDDYEIPIGVGGLNPEEIAEPILQSAASELEDILPNISDSEILITDSAGKEAVRNYLFDVYGVFLQYVPFTNEQDIVRFVQEVRENNFSRVDEVISAKEKAAADLEKITVPQEALQVHRHGMQIMYAGTDTLKELKTTGQDDMQVLYVFSKMQYLIDETKVLSQELSRLTKQYDLFNIPILE